MNGWLGRAVLVGVVVISYIKVTKQLARILELGAAETLTWGVLPCMCAESYSPLISAFVTSCLLTADHSPLLVSAPVQHLCQPGVPISVLRLDN